MKRLFIAIGPNIWGRGHTSTEAVKFMRAQQRGRVPDYNVYDVPPDTKISDLGDLSYPTPVAGDDDTLPPRLIKRVRNHKETTRE